MEPLSILGTVLVASLATWQVVEVWHHSELFADWRDRLRAGLDSAAAAGDGRPRGSLTSWLAQLLTCPWCLSVHVGMLLLFAGASGVWWLQYAVAGLAASRLANLGNDVFHPYCRTPRNTDLPIISAYEGASDVGGEHEDAGGGDGQA